MPVEAASPLAAEPVFSALFEAVVAAAAEVSPLPAPPAALTEPVLAEALLFPICPVPLAEPVVAVPFP